MKFEIPVLMLTKSRKSCFRAFSGITIAAFCAALTLIPSTTHATPILLFDWYSPGGLVGADETWDMNLLRLSINYWNDPFQPLNPLPFLPYPTEHDGQVRDSNVGQTTVTIPRDQNDVYLLLQSGPYDQLIYLIGQDTGDSVTISIPTLHMGGPPEGLVYYALFDAPALPPFPHISDSGDTFILLALGSITLMAVRFSLPGSPVQRH